MQILDNEALNYRLSVSTLWRQIRLAINDNANARITLST